MGKGWARGDFCTCAPDKLFGIDMSLACYAHDVNYMDKSLSRLECDMQFKKDLDKLGVNPIVSWTYYLFVRLFGWIYY